LLPDDLYEATIVIGHTRYSTSDIEYNQPISDGTRAIALNGVISQADPDKWPELFDVRCEGRNDAEIALQMLKQNRHPLLIEPSSQACVVINARENTLEFWRNEERPLYYLDTSEYTLVASTQDIFCRVGIRDSKLTQACVSYTSRLWPRIPQRKLELKSIRAPKEDLQG
jgi:glutamine phosphoribosylpyrophosphate amidotransferase